MSGSSAWIDRLAVLLLAMTAVALPVAFDPDSALPFPVAKAAVLGIAAYVLGITIVLRVLTAGFAALPRTWLLLPVAAYLAVMTAAAAFAVDTNIALWGAYDRRLGLVATYQMAVIFLAAATFVRARDDALVVLSGVGVGGLLVLGYAVAQRLGLDPIRWVDESVFSSLGNSNVMGHYFAVLAAASLAGMLGAFEQAPRRRLTTVLAALFGGFVLGTVLSGARAALLGLGIGAMTAVALFSWRLAVDRGRRVIVVVTATASVVLGAAALLYTPIGTRIATLAAGTDLSIGERSLLYRTILEIVAARPLLGVGPDNLAAVYNAHRPVEAFQFAGTLTTQSSAHGWPWRAVLDAGALGLLAFAAVAVALGIAAWMNLRIGGDWRFRVLAVGLVTYLAAGLVSVNALGTDWLFWLAAGLLVAASATRPIPIMSPLNGWRIPVAMVLAAGVLWPVVGLARDIEASRALRASRGLGDRNVGASLSQARMAVERDDRWPVHWNNLGLRAIQAGESGLALSAFTRASQLGWFDPLIWKNLGTLQAQLSRQQPALADRARQSATRAAAADPRNPVARAGAAQVYLLLADGSAAAREAEAALALAPANDEYLDLAATGYLLAGQAGEATRAVQRALAVRETWQRRFLLARALVLDSRYVEARVQLRRVLELNPGNQSALALLGEIAER